MTRRLAVVGMGKMGRTVDELAASRGWEVVARIRSADAARGIDQRTLNSADVAVEFTIPGAAPSNIRAIVAAGCPVVSGTTGWYAQLDDVARDSESAGGALLTAPNFSLGVNIFEQVVELAARLLGQAPSFDAHLIETHHAAKTDAPSGTAATLNRTASRAWGRGPEIPITSVRTGAVPGTHEFVFDAPFEQIHLEHIARDRRVFAEGALVAAAWLIGRRGAFTMRDVLMNSLNEPKP
ncbi:MAG TPA: dihydrodipicolinate reductase C-terminal domain-containing protein [Gemmatimonadaceae bacterium]|jgi:4-hydroxy-tetrahydrodipicolinate reductase|nr:dihydrodipicolinate reductase C-terminal domain-containing protein [Gemmatimonadaceae bacterium]